jgi:hypothetical protein
MNHGDKGIQAKSIRVRHINDVESSTLQQAALTGWSYPMNCVPAPFQGLSKPEESHSTKIDVAWKG